MSRQKTQKKAGTFWIWSIWGVTSLFYLYEYFLRVAPSVMIHDIMLHFQITAGALGALVAFYYYAYAPMQIAVGVLLDRLGGKRVLPLAALICASGALLFGMTSNYWVAAGGRFLMGLGSAFAFVGAIYVATNWFESRYFAMLSGLTTMLGMLGAFAGQGPTAFVTHHAGWQITWFGIACFGGILSLVLLLMVPNRPRWAKKNVGHSVFQNLRRVLKNPQTWIIGLYSGLIYVPTSVFAALWGVPFLEVAYGLDKITAATAVSIIFLGWAVGGPLAGILSDKIRRRKPPLILSCLGVGVLSTLLIYGGVFPLWLVYAILFLIGVFSGGQVVCFAAAFEANPFNAKGTSLAVTNMLTMSTAPILQPAVGLLLDWREGGSPTVGTSHFTLADYQFAFLVVPLTLILALIFSFLIRETHGKTPKN